MGGVLGLDYPGVETLMRIIDVKQPRQAFEDLQAMEAAVLKELARE